MKLMALDYGSKRVGVASTDGSGQFAIPRAVWSNDSGLVDRILEFVENEGIGKIILGKSTNFSGENNPIQEEIENLKHKLEKHKLGVVYHPEIFTTVEARRLQGQTQMTDASAAALILKSFIDTV